MAENNFSLLGMYVGGGVNVKTRILKSKSIGRGRDWWHHTCGHFIAEGLDSIGRLGIVEQKSFIGYCGKLR